jgi:hypothetical protein
MHGGFDEGDTLQVASNNLADLGLDQASFDASKSAGIRS